MPISQRVVITEMHHSEQDRLILNSFEYKNLRKQWAVASNCKAHIRSLAVISHSTEESFPPIFGCMKINNSSELEVLRHVFN